MKYHLYIMVSAIAVACLLGGCEQKEADTQGYAKLEPTVSEVDNSSGAQAAEDAPATPMVWEQTLEVGKLCYQIDAVHVITNASEIGEGGFGERSEIVLYDGAFYDRAMEDWRQYGSQYEQIYPYPEYIQADGQFLDGTCMIALDMRVTSQDATNQWRKADGELESRYGNPYLFKVDSILYLLDTGDTARDGTYLGVPPGFFSEYGGRSEHPYAYEVKPGETVTFRIGFLMGNRSDGTSRDLADLVVCTQSNSLDNAVWFDLQLEEFP